jgi:phosphopantothenoylcysteine decarboxylase/phosphopantothenate--cysteine ligase
MENLRNYNILITAGPTIEKIDPVRYLSNFSSGKMGYALAEAAAELQAAVTIISGPTNLKIDNSVNNNLIQVINVISSQDMYDAVKTFYCNLHCINNQDNHQGKQETVFISCAAVCDYQVSEYKESKIKKITNSNGSFILELIPTEDILRYVGNLPNKPLTIGFCAETENLIENAKRKLESKNADIIIANDVSDNKVFNSDFNEVYMIKKAISCYVQKYEYDITYIEYNTKKEVAKQILQNIIRAANSIQQSPIIAAL